MLSAFRALPTEDRARRMKDRDFLWCLCQSLLDREEELDRLCPECRKRAEEERCPVCGKSAGAWGEGSVNPSFDPERFRRLREGERP